MRWRSILLLVAAICASLSASGAAALDDFTERVRDRLVRVDLLDDNGNPHPTDCGTGVLINSEMLLTAGHVVPPGTTRVRVRSKQLPDGVIIKIDEILTQDNSGLTLNDYKDHDVVLLPLGTEGAALWARVADPKESTAFAHIPAGQLGGNFTAKIVPPRSMQCNDAPDAGETISRKIPQPRVSSGAGGAQNVYATIKDIPGSNSSGSPVLSTHTGHIVGVYTGSNNDTNPPEGRVVWLGSKEISTFWLRLNAHAVSAAEKRRAINFGVRASAALVQPEMANDPKSRLEYSVGAWVRPVLKHFEGALWGFDSVAFEAEFFYRGGLKQRMQVYQAPGSDKVIEDAVSYRHALGTLVHLQAQSYYHHAWNVSLGTGFFVQCVPEKSCEDGSQRSGNGQRLGFSAAVLRVHYSAGPASFFVGYRLDRVPTRTYRYQLLGDVEPVGDARVNAHVFELGIGFGRATAWRLVY